MNQGGGLRGPEQQKKILMVLMILLLLVVGWRYVRPAVAGWAAGKNAQSKAKRRVSKTRSITNKPIVLVKVEDLIAEASAYEPNRNIFRYGQRVVKRAPQPVRTPPKPQPVKPPPVIAREPSKPKPPPIDFELMGIFGPENRRIAVLVDGKEIINALREDVIKDQFIVNEIGLQSVEFRFVDFPAEETARIEIGKR